MPSHRLAIVPILALSAFRGLYCAAPDWRPITQRELDLKAPTVDGDADGEAIFWEVRVKDELMGNEPRQTITNYIRIKIFKEHGTETLGTVNLDYLNKVNVTDVAGRTIRPDGTIVELTNDAVFQRTLVRGRRVKIEQTSFAMPGVEPGAIIEYRWKEVHSGQISQFLALPLQRTFPVEELVYHIRPVALSYLPFQMRYFVFNCNDPKFERQSDGYFRIAWSDVPAFRPEPQMPPENEVKRWMLIYYEADKIATAEKYWKDVGSQLFEATKGQTKIDDEVKELAAEIVSGAKNDDEKLRLILNHCQNKLRNTQSAEMTLQQRAAAKQNHNPSDTLKRGTGSSFDITLAFIALANAAGYDARIAYLSDRSENFFQPSRMTRYFLRSTSVAVRVSNEWRFYDPANPYLPPGELQWQHEGVPALVADPTESGFFKTPLTPAERSKAFRMASLQLDDQGSISGSVRETLNGQLGLESRESLGRATDTERAEVLKKSLELRFPHAEITEISFAVPGDAAVPVVINYKVKISGYAQKTGKRLFVAPGFFEAGTESRFSSSTRQFPVYFHFPWSEVDHVEISLPAGYELDHADAPMPVKFEPLGSDTVSIHFNPKINTLIYDREFVFGRSGALVIPKDLYPALKQVFDQVHKSDTHLMTLKLDSPTSSASEAH